MSAPLSGPALAQGQEDSQLGRQRSQQLALRFVMSDPLAFREYFIPRVSQRRFLHRYTFSRAVFGIDQGDAVLKAGRGTGKCLITNTLIYDPRTGVRRPMAEWQAGDEVIGLSEKIRLVSAEVTALIPSGVQPCVEVVCRSGRRVVCTATHPLLTPDGWKAAGAVTAMDRLAAPMRLPHPSAPAVLPDAVVDLAAILLADGALTVPRPAVRFSKPDPIIQGIARTAADALGCDLRVSPVRVDSCSIVRRDPRQQHPVRVWMDRVGLQWVRSPERRVPDAIFRLPAEALARFLAVYWMCDGHVDRRGQPQLVVASRPLAEDIQHLLLRFGIHARVSYKAARCGDKTFDAWRVLVYGASYEAFAQSIPLWGTARARLTQPHGKRGWIGAAPGTSVRQVFVQTWAGLGRASRDEARQVVAQHGIPLSHQRDPMRPLKEGTAAGASVRAWAEALGLDAEVLLTGSPDLWWDPVEIVRPAGMHAVGDLSVPECGNFVAGDLVVHNSFEILEPELVRYALNHPGEETLLTSLRRLHVVDRMERVIDYFSLPILAPFIVKIVRQPHYTIQLINGHMIYGISVGDDVEAKMIQGKHAAVILIEEAHQYPMRGWIKLQGATDPRGARFILIGVPDGRIDTPFRKADTEYDQFKGRRFQVSRRSDPYFSQKVKKKLTETLGDETGDLFIQEVDAEWGMPVWSAWDLDAIYRCQVEQLPRIVVKISGKVYREQGLTPATAFGELPGVDRDGTTMLVADIGYTQPTEVGILQLRHNAWALIARIELFNRMEHDDQTLCLAELVRRYRVSRIGIDTSEGEGRAIATGLEHEFPGTVTRVTFTENVVSGFLLAEDGMTWQPELELCKPLSTRLLRTALAQREILLPPDDEITAEFNREKETRSPSGLVIVRTPADVHIPEMLRVFAMTRYLESPPQPPVTETEWSDDVEWGTELGTLVVG